MRPVSEVVGLGNQMCTVLRRRLYLEFKWKERGNSIHVGVHQLPNFRRGRTRLPGRLRGNRELYQSGTPGGQRLRVGSLHICGRGKNGRSIVFHEWRGGDEIIAWMISKISRGGV